MVFNDRIYPDNQNVVFKAEVYDKDFKLNNVPNVSVTIKDSSDRSNTYTFDRTGNSYVLDLKSYTPGDYRWNAETVIEGKRYKKSGIFSVLPNTIESENLRANHNILFKLTQKTNGKLFYPDQSDDLADHLINNENIIPVSFSEKSTENLINFKIIFILLLLLLTAEWFMRKFHGSY
jgi:hypothetical protein